MHRIILAQLKQETATFNPARTVYDDFQVHVSRAILDAYRGTQTELAGALDTFSAEGGVEPIPTTSATAVSGGPIQTAALQRLLSELVRGVRRNQDADAAYICFHGAMAGDDEGDPEGRALRQIREVLGERPIVVSLDLHAVISDRLVQAADILVPFHTYPHVDQYQTGERSARLLLGMLRGEILPTTARVELPMLVRGDELITATGRFGEAIDMCRQIEQSPGGLAAGVIIGNAFTDVPDLQSNVLVTTDSDLDRAQSEAERIARFMWDHRQLFQAQLTPLDEAIRLAHETPGLTVFSDGADATASGAPGDSNAILRGLLQTSFDGKALVPIVDRPAVEQAFAAGVGSVLKVALGGTLDADRFTPLEVSAYVRSLHDGNFYYEDKTAGCAGRTAVLIVKGIHILVTERAVYVVGRRVFQAHGLDPPDFGLVVVKSPNGFRTWYESIATRIVAVDVPGATSADLKSLPFKNCVRPIFPLDDDVKPPAGLAVK